ncbi:hypothetical protein CICLE_v10032964mg [Citrus x clementina]|uniref:Cysteine-rich transmembrane CYSTM domain-containing protein n=1 Tax=Citrus clementina TaxID=85681 RepID=V4VHJ6_CITCL|nr:hypothetical protein CICLE_v10032964mg [Citrus x clementina]
MSYHPVPHDSPCPPPGQPPSPYPPQPDFPPPQPPVGQPFPPPPPPGYQGYFNEVYPPPPPAPQPSQDDHQNDTGCCSCLKGWYAIPLDCLFKVIGANNFVFRIWNECTRHLFILVCLMEIIFCPLFSILKLLISEIGDYSFMIHVRFFFFFWESLKPN